MSFERPYYEDLNCHPLLFYVVFGVDGEELTVSRERHHVDAFPDGLNLISYRKPEHEEYMAELIGGTIGEILNADNHALYEAVKDTKQWVIIRGEVLQDANLNYMRNVIGFVQALVETGAVGVLDLQTFTLYSPEEWTNSIFSKEFDPYAHVMILVSAMEDGAIWLHTRGMRKFGRCKPNPDYYREILKRLGAKPEECLMVGNDVEEDMAAEKIGMRVFLLTDCLINKEGCDISAFPNGSFEQLTEYVVKHREIWMARGIEMRIEGCDYSSSAIL